MPEIEVRRPIPLRSVPGVELAAVGTWAASTGITTFTQEDMANAVGALDCPGVRNPVIKLGHDEPDSTSGIRWDGEPAVGWIGNMHLDGAKLVGDYMGMPEWLTATDENGMAVLATAYPDRSIEIRRPFVCQVGHTHPSVITAVSLLGVYAPGVGVLKSMQDVYAAFTEPLSGDELATLSAPLLRTTVKLAAEDEQRDLTDVEIRATTDFAALDAAWTSALDDLLEEWPDVAKDQRAALAAQIAEAVDSRPDDLGELTLDSAAATALLLAAMAVVAKSGADEQVAEARRQGVAIDPPEITDELVADPAAAVAAAMASSTASTAGRTAAQLLGTGDGVVIADKVSAHLATLSDRFLRDQLGGALSAAQAAGRFAVLDGGPTGDYYASEVADRRACSNCRSIDGTQFESLDEARGAYGSGKYVACQGGARCRGQLITVFDADAKAAAPISTTVRMSLSGGAMPAQTRLDPNTAVQASVSVEDISRKYYESAGYSMWITAMHVDPLELIASDDTDGKFFRIPVELSAGGEFTFGEPQEVAVVYEDVKAAAKALPHRWGSKQAAMAAAGVVETKPGEFAVQTEETKPGIAPEVSPAGAAIRKMASGAATAEPEAPTETPDAGSAAGSTTENEEASVDAAKLREALGLAATASDDEVRTAVASAFTPTPPTVQETDPAALLAALPTGSDAMLLDRENYKTLVAMAKKGEVAFATMQRNERDVFLRQAAQEGRFPVSRLSAYSEMWDKDPAATKDFVSLMPKNSIPVMASGVFGAEVDENEGDAAYSAMYPKGAR